MEPTDLKSMLVASLLMWLGGTAVAAEQVAADSDRWLVRDRHARVMTYLGRQTLYLHRGWAAVKDIDFADGVIECDVVLHGHPSFAGVVFRATLDDPGPDGELIYLRPHRSRTPDALQYTPVFGGTEAWQLYNGPGFTAAAELPANRWVHLKVEVRGQTARLFLDESAQPSLVVTQLKRGRSRGLVGLWGRLGGASFSNFVVTSEAGAASAGAEQVALPSGMIRRWRLSPAFDAATVQPRTLPNTKAAAPWESVESEAGGLLNIAQYRRKVTPVQENPNDNGRDIVFAGATLRAERDMKVRLDFGYSDRVTVFLNGSLLFEGNGAFLSRDASFLGTIGLHDTLYLDLRKGTNEIVFGVADQFGGWGVKARVDPAAGVTVE